MLYHLLYPLSRDVPWLSFFRVFQYPSFRIVGASITALLIGFLIGPWFIRRLAERQIGQVVRDDGPQTHLAKKGTPTMGGSLILFALVVPVMLWAELTNPYVWMATTVTVMYGALGFLDDYLKIRRGNPRGLPAWGKLAGQFVVAAAVLAVLFYHYGFSTQLTIPFVRWDIFAPDLGRVGYIVFGSLIIVGMSNAVNLTDGADGLAAGPLLINAGVYLILTYVAGSTLQIWIGAEHGGLAEHVTVAEYLRVWHVPGVEELGILCGAVLGAAMAFLWFNTFPAQLFMGDVGALALGGLIGTMAVITKNEILALILGGIFVLEVVSVIIQVSSFKLTGKRVFRMSPLHHHFELKGWAEPQVVVRFWIVQALLALVALASLKLR